MQQQWSDIVLDAMRDVGQRLLYVTPRLLAALTLILLAWAVASLVRRVDDPGPGRGGPRRPMGALGIGRGARPGRSPAVAHRAPRAPGRTGRSCSSDC